MTPELATPNIEEVSDLERTLYTTDIDVSIQETEEKGGFFQRVADSVNGAIDSYFKPKSFERWDDGKIYRWLGVKHFKKILPTGGDYVARWIGWRPIANASSKEEGLRDYEKLTRSLELIHSVLFPLYTTSMIQDLTDGDLESAGWMLIKNLAVNVYPIMVQRYNRARIYNALDRIESDRAEGGRQYDTVAAL